MLNVKVIDAIFKGMTSVEKLKQELHITDEQLHKVLSQHNIDSEDAVQQLQWKIHQAIDFAVRTVDDTDDLYAVTVATTKYLNDKHPKLNVNNAIVRQLLLTQFKSSAERRAYIELCEGELKPYNLYTQNDPTLFVNYLIKSIVNSNCARLLFPRRVIRVIQFIASKYYSNTEPIVRSQLRSLNLLKGTKYEVYTKVLNKNNRLLNIDQVPYKESYERIFTSIAEAYANEIEEQKISLFFEQFTEEGRQAMATRKREKQKQRKQEVAKTQEVEVQKTTKVEVTETMPETLRADGQAVRQEKAVEHVPLNDALQQEHAQLQERYNLAAEAIRTLEHELHEKTQEVAKVKQDTLEMVFKKLGNARSNYLLSDLYRISVGQSDMTTSMIADQLMNLFDILGEDFHIEVLSNGHKIGDIFTIVREELVTTYQALNMITLEQSDIKVELVQYGWSLNNKKIVQPLVKIIEQSEVM